MFGGLFLAGAKATIFPSWTGLFIFYAHKKYPEGT
jgi:hypothetical protein